MIERSLLQNTFRNRFSWVRAITLAATVLIVVFPFGLLILISLGSGWSFPRLIPDRLDYAAWKHVFSDRDQMLVAIRTSVFMSLTVAALSVTFSRRLWVSTCWIGRLMASSNVARNRKK